MTKSELNRLAFSDPLKMAEEISALQISLDKWRSCARSIATALDEHATTDRCADCARLLDDYERLEADVS